MKGQPLAYNKDNQEDKEPLFDAIDTLRDSLRAFAEMLARASRRTPAAMRRAAEEGFSTATDLADYLVRQVACRSAMRTRRSHARCAWPAIAVATSPHSPLADLQAIAAGDQRRRL